MAYLMFWSICR